MLSRRHSYRLAIAAMMAHATFVGAQTCPDKLGPAEQIACLQTENAVLKARIEHIELMEKLGGDRDTRNLGIPTVLATFGVKDRSQAILSWSGSGGGVLTVKPGQNIPGGWTVTSIEHGRVVIQKGRVSHVLLLARESSRNVSAYGMETEPALPSQKIPLTPMPAMRLEQSGSAQR